MLTVVHNTVDHDGVDLAGYGFGLLQPVLIVEGIVGGRRIQVPLECVPVQYEGLLALRGPRAAFDWDFSEFKEVLAVGGISVELPPSQ